MKAAKQINGVSLRFVLCMMGLLSITACTNYEYHETKNVRLDKPSDFLAETFDEKELLDVSVVLFDEGVDELDDESFAYANLRRSEAVWFSSQLRDTLERSNVWGLVRTVPIDNAVTDVTVKGRLIDSNGEVVILEISVADSSGKHWFTKEYDQRASSYAYNPEVRLPGDPFQAVFNEIANDISAYHGNLTSAQRLNLRSITKVKFARDFVPQAFDGFLTQGDDDVLSLQRIPASSDPMMLRVERIQARNDLYLDVVQDYYRAFNRNMSAPYNEWRKNSYKEVVYERQLRAQARNERIAGVAAIIGGIALSVEGDSGAARAAGTVSIFGGAQLFRRSYSKADEANIHSEALREMGSSLESQLEPSVIDLQERSVTLSGTVEDQYKEWRRILSRMFLLDEGLVTNPDTSLSDSAPEIKATNLPFEPVKVN